MGFCSLTRRTRWRLPSTTRYCVRFSSLSHNTQAFSSKMDIMEPFLFPVDTSPFSMSGETLFHEFAGHGR